MQKILILFLLACVSCSHEVKKSEPQDHFAGVEGCFLLFNLKTEKFERMINEKRCGERFTPFSSFKVPLAVMGFDSGFLKDENMVLKWDGKKDERPEVNQDHNAKTFMRDSVVWFSQRITSQLGKKRFQQYLRDFDYGNQDIRGGLTQTWLVRPSSKEPSLKISAFEQVEFMRKLWTGKLKASARAQQLTRDITFIETSPNGYRLSGKTGSNFYDDARKLHFGWFISHLQKGDQEYIAVANLSDLVPYQQKGYGGWRVRQITKDILAEMGLW